MLISRKLPLAAALLTVVSIAASSIGGLVISSNALKSEYDAKLSAIADGRRNQIETYLEATKKDIEEIAVTPNVAAALNLFGIGLTTIKDGMEPDFLALVSDHTLSQDEKLERSRPSGARVYLNHEGKFGPVFEKIAEENDFEDILLVKADGTVVYTLLKRDDFYVNLSDAAWKDTPLGLIHQNTMSMDKTDGVAFADYLPYAPGERPLTAFVGKPIVVGGEVKGAFIVSLPTGKIEQIMSNRTGLGETGETVLLRNDGYLLTNSPLTEANDVHNARIDPALFGGLTARDIVNSETGDYRDMQANVAFARVNFLNADWVVAALVDNSEAGQAVASMRQLVIVASLVLLAVALASALLFSRTLTRPIIALVANMRELTEGRTDFQIDNMDRKDEIGDMVRSVAVFKEATIEKERLEHEAEETRETSEREASERATLKAEETQQLQAAVDSLAGGLTRLSEGDLSVRLDTPFMDSLDRLRIDFNATVEKLNSTLYRIQDGSGSIDGNARQMRAAADDLSRRTEQQAASLEETSAALEEITSTVRETSERAAEAATMAEAAKADADQSSAVVSDAVAAMEGIEKASQEISNIINVIDEIAFQTNLLALNAGVEAARAGEAGKGFAVVAQEVRELAQRAAGAATEIKELITKSGTEVSNGVGLVKATGEALDQISHHVTDINGRIANIATAAREQLTGIQEVNTAVTQMDQMTQQNAAMVEQTNAVVHQLADDADGLSSVVGEFSLADGNSESGETQAAPADAANYRMAG
ncbi:methyl-accepting chemotaxis protein [Hoeflea sp. TYP-13]|uniref:methyl-accepting chemotaxis protein n=1 Tax=Hoeflea sp. TYP-13 TaxID=3230023 RepID=UPI0034C5FEC8